MKKRIHDELMRLLRAGPYHSCTVNPKTGQMTVNTSVPLNPNGCVVKEIGAAYQLTQRFKRQFGVSERTQWSWVARLEFPATEVSTEAFEDSLADNGIQIPPYAGDPDQRTVLARLVRAEYTHPPEQSPNGGTVVEFLFEVLPETLRK